MVKHLSSKICPVLVSHVVWCRMNARRLKDGGGGGRFP